MADDDPRQAGEPRPSPDLPDGALAEVGEAVSLLRGVIGSPATTDIDGGRSGQLAPPHSPSNASSGGDQPGGMARARHPGEERAVPSVADILADPKKCLPQTPPGHGPAHGHGRGVRR